MKKKSCNKDVRKDCKLLQRKGLCDTHKDYMKRQCCVTGCKSKWIVLLKSVGGWRGGGVE